MQDVMVSVHIPKTGGTSLKKVLSDIYGTSLVADYPTAKGRPEWMSGAALHPETDLQESLAGIGCIHGHFSAAKYRPLIGADGVRASFVTWLRDPVERAVSAYHFLRRAPVRAGAISDWQQKARDLDIETYFRTTNYGRNTQANMLRGVDLSEFAFVGITERFAQSMRIFLSMFSRENAPQSVPHERRNEERRDNGYDISDDLRSLLTEANKDDFALYNRALDRLGGNFRE